MSPNPAERRKFARLDIALTVSYAVLNPGGKPSDFAEAQSSDISAGGLRLMTPSPLNNGDKLELSVYLAGEEDNPISATGATIEPVAVASSCSTSVSSCSPYQ